MATTRGRSPTETSIGLFWGYGGAKGLGTPPRLYGQVIRQVAKAQGNDIAKNARLFAVINAAMGDAGILAWNEKYSHDGWRPVLGIREHDPSSGPTGVGGDVRDPDADPGWIPLGAQGTSKVGQRNFTPFPAYPSGRAMFGAAVLQSVRQFYGHGEYGPDCPAGNLEFVSDGINVDNAGAVWQRRVRKFPRGLWQMIEENGFSRVSSVCTGCSTPWPSARQATLTSRGESAESGSASTSPPAGSRQPTRSAQPERELNHPIRGRRSVSTRLAAVEVQTVEQTLWWPMEPVASGCSATRTTPRRWRPVRLRTSFFLAASLAIATTLRRRNNGAEHWFVPDESR